MNLIQHKYQSNGPGRPKANKCPYPFAEMRVGSCFTLPPDSQMRVHRAAWYHRTHRDGKFYIRTKAHKGRLLVERVAAPKSN